METTTKDISKKNFSLENGGGKRYLVRRSIDKKAFAPEVLILKDDNLTDRDVDLRMSMAKLADSLLPSQVELLSSVMLGCYQYGADSGFNNTKRELEKALNGPDTLCTRQLMKDLDKFQKDSKHRHDECNLIPRTTNDIKTELTHGQHSIIKNLPSPVIKELDGHSYVLPEDCIRDFFGHWKERRVALLLDELLIRETGVSCRHFSESARAKQCLEMLKKESGGGTQSKRGTVMFFTDDVEPNKSNKSNRGSVWLAVMTIGTELGDANNPDHTYPVAIGKKGQCHDGVLSKLEENMCQLRQGIDLYVGSTKEMIKMQFTDFVHLGDQPERRALNHLQLGNGTYHTRFGVSANHKACYESLKACPKCSEVNEARMKTTDLGTLKQAMPECSLCLNWDVLSNNELGHHVPPDGYPLMDGGVHQASQFCRLVTTKDSGGSEKQMIKPFRVTYEGLKGAVALAHDCFLNHGWTMENVRAYLKVETINDEFARKVGEHALNCYTLQTCHEMRDKELMETLKIDASKHPAKCAEVECPPMWKDSVELEDLWPNVIMHLLCLGVTKTVLKRIDSFLKKTKKRAALTAQILTFWIMCRK